MTGHPTSYSLLGGVLRPMPDRSVEVDLSCDVNRFDGWLGAPHTVSPTFGLHDSNRSAIETVVRAFAIPQQLSIEVAAEHPTGSSYVAFVWATGCLLKMLANPGLVRAADEDVVGALQDARASVRDLLPNLFPGGPG